MAATCAFGLSNESKGNVYFDDIRVEHQQGPLLEENHYYPYGLKMAALCSKAFGSLLNKFQYQGDYSEFDEETGYDEFALRNYDPQLGRWTGVDPYDQYGSPYLGMGSNPTNRIDPDGGFDFTAPALGAFVGWSAGLTYGVLSGKHDPLKYGLIGAGIGVAVGLGIELGPQLFNFLGKGGGSVGENFLNIVINVQSNDQQARNVVYHPHNDSNLGGDDDGDDAVTGISSQSFKFVKTFPNWQEAGVSKIKTVVNFIGGPRNGTSISVIIQYPLIFGLPIKRGNGDEYDASDAADRSAEAVENASFLIKEQIKADPFASRETIQSSFIKNMKLFMLNYGGRVDRSGSGNPKIKITEADYDWF